MLIKGSFEDYFYILVGLIWVAFSIYKGMQKKKSKQATGDQVKKKSVLETLMDEFLEKEQQIQPEPIIYEAPIDDELNKEKAGDEPFSYDDIYEKSNYNEADELYTKKPVDKSKLKANLNLPRKTRKRTQFDLRKAVIYSEILNRRYF